MQHHENSPRIAVLWNELPGYAIACLDELRQVIGSALWCGSIGHPAVFVDAARAAQLRVETFLPLSDPRASVAQILARLQSFAPDVLLASGWASPTITRVARHLKAQGVLTVCLADTPWLGNMRQTGRCLLGRRQLHHYYDILWITGERGVPIAKLAGFSGRHCWQGLYSGDAATFSTGTPARLDTATLTRQWPQRFLFVGRLVPAKNITLLTRAYQRYRHLTDNPWPLTCIGDGPLRHALAEQPGIAHLTGASPTAVSEMMAHCGCFVLPSAYEPWGVVVHEATCAGLPLLLTAEVGASAHLLRDGYNGRLVDTQDADDLSHALRWMSEHREPWLLGARSYALSQQFSPRLWAEYLLQQTDDHLHHGVSVQGKCLNVCALRLGDSKTRAARGSLVSNRDKTV